MKVRIYTEASAAYILNQLDIQYNHIKNEDGAPYLAVYEEKRHEPSLVSLIKEQGYYAAYTPRVMDITG